MNEKQRKFTKNQTANGSAAAIQKSEKHKLVIKECSSGGQQNLCAVYKTTHLQKKFSATLKSCKRTFCRKWKFEREPQQMFNFCNERVKSK